MENSVWIMIITNTTYLSYFLFFQVKVAKSLLTITPSISVMRIRHIKGSVKIAPIADKFKGRLPCYGHITRSNEENHYEWWTWKRTDMWKEDDRRRYGWIAWMWISLKWEWTWHIIMTNIIDVQKKTYIGRYYPTSME